MSHEHIIEPFIAAGLLPALIEAARILSSADGQGKHGEQGWRGVPSSELREKARVHLEAFATLDPDSGCESTAHALIRSAMLCTRALEIQGENEQ